MPEPPPALPRDAGDTPHTAGAPDRRILVVLGMHRAGTSAIARSLHVLGVHLGNRLMPPVAGVNDRGFWEDLDIHDLSCEMLQELGADWHHLMPWHPDILPRLHDRGFFRRAVDLLEGKLARNPVIGIKNPRTAMLLPFWQAVFADCAAQTSYVLAIRNPLSIVQSLVHRDRFDEEKISLLWLLHMVPAAETLLQGHRGVVVDYDQLLQDPQGELRRMAAALDLPFDAQAGDAYERDFLTQELRHTHHSIADLQSRPFLGPMTCPLYSALAAVAAGVIGADSPQLRDAAAGARAELVRWEPALALLHDLFEFKRTAQHELAARTDQVQQWQNRGRERDRQITDLLRRLAAPESPRLRACLESDWYRQRNPDLANAGVDPYHHWFSAGAEEGRIPCEDPPGLAWDLIQDRIQEAADRRAADLQQSFAHQLNAVHAANREGIAALKREYDGREQVLHEVIAQNRNDRLEAVKGEISELLQTQIGALASRTEILHESLKNQLEAQMAAHTRHLHDGLRSWIAQTERLLETERDMLRTQYDQSLALLQQDLRTLESSVAWRLSAPIRAITALFGSKVDLPRVAAMRPAPAGRVANSPSE